jgi:hypothetical protein
VFGLNFRNFEVFTHAKPPACQASGLCIIMHHNPLKIIPATRYQSGIYAGAKITKNLQGAELKIA